METATAPAPEAPSSAPSSPTEGLGAALSSYATATKDGRVRVDQPRSEAKPEPKQVKSEAVVEKPKPTSRAAEMLDKLTDQDTAPATEAQPAEEFPDDAPKEQNAWTNIKKKVKEYEAKVKEYEEKLAKLPEYETKLKDYETTFDEKTRAELEDYRQRKAFEEIESTEQYQQEVLAPQSAHADHVRALAKHADIDENEIWSAMHEPNFFQRKEKLKELLSLSSREVDSDTAGDLARRGDELINIAHKQAMYQQHAQQLREQYHNKQSAEKMRLSEEANVLHQKAMSEINDTFKARIHDVLPAEAFDALAKAERPTDPMDIAYSAQAALLVPELVKVIRKMKAEQAAQAKQAEQRRGARPGMEPEAQKGGDSLPSLGSILSEYRGSR